MKNYLINAIVFFVFIFQASPCLSAKAKQVNKLDDLEDKLNRINYTWWFRFNDPILNVYILEALKNNSDLKLAGLRIDEFRKSVKMSFGSELPSIHLGLEAQKNHNNPLVLKKNTMTLPITVSYELDLFAKKRNKTKALKKHLESLEFETTNIYISLVSDVSSLYFNAVKLDKIIELLEELIAINRDIIEIKYDKHKHNLLSEVDINADYIKLRELENNLLETKRDRLYILTQLSVLLGRDPDNALSLERNKYDYWNPQFERPLNLKSDAIFSRPDVLAIEKALEEAEINIDVARKEFLPSINLQGGLIFNNYRSGFFNISNAITQLILNVGQDLFVGGRKKINLEIIKNKYEQIVESYKKTSLNAIKEINDVLNAIDLDYKIYRNTLDGYTRELENYNSNEVRYKNGLISFVELKELRQKVIDYKIKCIASNMQMIMDVIVLYKATGTNLN